MLRKPGIVLITLAASLAVALWLTQLPRFRAEKDALAEIATLTKSPVKYVCVEGVPGFQYVNTVWLQPEDVSVLQASDLGPCFNALPRLRLVVIEPKFASEPDFAKLRARYPGIEFATNVGFSWKPRYRFAYPRGSSWQLPCRGGQQFRI
jgi:hypothetical protein